MNILIVRHGIAEDRTAFAATGRGDEARPLTKKGIERMKEIARGLKQLGDDIDLIATSPLIRAKQTADILKKGFKSAALVEIPELSPGQGPTTLTDWLNHRYDAETICLVGHEPDLSELIAWLSSGRAEGFTDLKKGGATLLTCPGQPERAGCTLAWMLSPKQMRLMAATK